MGQMVGKTNVQSAHSVRWLTFKQFIKAILFGPHGTIKDRFLNDNNPPCCVVFGAEFDKLDKSKRASL